MIILNFAKENLRISNLDPADQEELVDAINILAHCNFHKKNFQFIEGLDFSIIRDLITSYNEQAHERIMSNRHFAFLFFHFFEAGKEEFMIERRLSNTSEVYSEILLKELTKLKNEALNAFP